MAPEGAKHKQTRLKTKKDRQLHQRLDALKSKGDAAQDAGPDVTNPETTITTTKYPLFETWERLESAQVGEITHQHKHTTGWLLPQIMPVLVHVAAPQAGRFTREVQSNIDNMNSIEAVKDLVKNSLLFELKRTNIEVTKAQFAGLMVYGPTTEFKPDTIKSFTRGLFLQEAAFKDWWLTVAKSQRVPGDMVKIAVVLWHSDEAATKQVTLPNFWTANTARLLRNHLEKLETLPWDLDIEGDCRSYVKMQEQMLEARVKAVDAETKAMKADDLNRELKVEQENLIAAQKCLDEEVNTLTKLKDSLVKAIEANDMESAARLVAASQKSSKQKDKGKVEETEEGEAEDVKMMDGGDDPNDSDYVED
ncbi:hypothetical protein AYL99_10429 [Fonsecaea erecta]|uniref:Uncharacterized protein n=1 Tax=Fonsecaea erecta TaxID=1367422 RepID=A0A178Z7N6_9EURO|nr:hypothetical protein AYL99_10429 [Fonsecaea erecta]OAP55456.1 hypothetical protein AYL99_10429 [Fonsecaea erecta]